MRPGTRPFITVEPLESANSADETLEKVTVIPPHCLVGTPSSYGRKETKLGASNSEAAMYCWPAVRRIAWSK